MWDYVKEVSIGHNEMWLAFDGSYDSEGVFTISSYEVWDDETCKGYNYSFDGMYEKYTTQDGKDSYIPVMHIVVEGMEEEMTEQWEPDDGADEAYDLMRDMRNIY